MRIVILAAALLVTALPAWALPTQTFEGRVISTHEGMVKLDVAGDTVEVTGTKSQLEALEPGDHVRVTAEPLLQAEDVVPLQGAFAGNQMIGRVERIGKSAILVKTNRGYERVQVDPSQIQGIKEGQAVMIQLREAPLDAESWRIRKVKPIG